MAETPALRRSGRERVAVKTYAEEQAEENTITQMAAPKRKHATAKDSGTAIKKVRKTPIKDDEPFEFEKDQPLPKKRSKTAIEDELSSDFEEPEPPKKRSKAAIKREQAAGKVDAAGIRRLVTTELRPPGERQMPQIWDVPKKPKGEKQPKGFNLAALMAETFEERRQKQVSRIPRLQEGQKEKRIKSHVSEETESYNTFLERARSQKMFVLERFRGTEEDCHANHEDCPYHEVKLAGTTGNVYSVIISHLPTCSCPNTAFKAKASGDALCKHILYVLHFVLKAPDHLCYQNAFLTSELKEIDANAPAMPKQVQTEEPMDGKRKPVEDDCPICCMEFEEGEDIVWCRAACGNNVHKTCFQLWKSANRTKVTCPFCRSEWEDEGASKTKGASLADVKLPTQRGQNGYFNVRDQLAYE